MNIFYFFCIILCSITVQVESTVNSDAKVNLPPPKMTDKQGTLPPCQACRMLTTAFKKGIERTSRGKFEGGDALWEESRLGSYSDSEIRLVEIQENLCAEEKKAADQCHHLAEKYEPFIEEWWLNKKAQFPDIYYYLCIDKLEVCCPDNHYGPECKPCFGGIINPCNNHGRCKGGGTRKGSGTCRCEDGYSGDFCQLCVIGYYNDTSNSDGKCTKCDTSCKNHCREGGPKGCEVCSDGFQYTTEFGCADVDECIELRENPCGHGTFCVNSMGSYKCLECSKSCDGCTGDGPDMCEKCAKGYVFQDPMCIESQTYQRTLRVEFARYATYLGLSIATFIIFRRNTFIACVIGLFVAIYIGLSEYSIGEWDQRSLVKSIKTLTVL